MRETRYDGSTCQAAEMNDDDLHVTPWRHHLLHHCFGLPIQFPLLGIGEQRRLEVTGC